MNHYSEATQLFSAIIRGDSNLIDSQPEREPVDELQMAAAYHGVGPLVGHMLTRRSDLGDHRSSLLKLFQSPSHENAAVELIRRHELMKVLEACADKDIRPLLLKGTPLAYSHYSSPALRPRGDSDLFIRETDAHEFRRILEGLGYQSPNAVTGEWISHQFTAQKYDDFGIYHAFDVHSKLSNQQLFTDLFTYEDLCDESVPVESLGPNARTLSAAHALIFACAHRVGHRHAPYYVNGEPYLGGDRLIWLYDLHLLISSMSASEIKKFTALAKKKKVRTVCLDGLERARSYFDTPLSDELLTSLETFDNEEPSARYLVPGRLHHLLNEFSALPNWRARASLMREHAFPPADYVLRKYNFSSRAWLPALYLYRGLCGVCKLMNRQ